MYSTCTVKQDRKMIDNVKWIQDNLPFKLQSLNGIVPEQLKCDKRGCLQILSGTIWHGWIFRVIIYKRIKGYGYDRKEGY